MATTAELLAGLKQKIITLGEQQQGEGISVSDFVNKTIKSIEIPEGTTEIKDYLFYRQTKLASVKIPYGVKKIGDHTFSYCESLTSINIPDSVTGIAGMAFEKCESLKNITIPDSVTFIGGYAFQSCINLTSITIPNKVTSIGMFVFNGCKSLSSLIIPNSVTSIHYSAFKGCSNLKFVTLGDGFNCDNLNLSASTKFAAETIKNMFIALADRTGQTAYTLTLGAENLAKLTEEEKQIATNKNWNLA